MTFAKIGKQLIALFLCMAIALGPSISAANAEEQSELSAAGKSTEVMALRQENEKHFSMDNGTYQAITYGHPVHELDSNGNWQDIDFSLTLSGTRGNRKYTNESATASFPEQYIANQPILTLGEKDRTIAIALLVAEKDGASNRAAVTAEVTNPQNSFRTLEEAKNANFSSTVLYKDALPGVDLEYIVDPGTVKENIIVKEKASSYRYTFTLNMTGLYPTLLKDGSIIVRDQETDAKKYEIPAPFMYDALGNMSEDVTYTLLGTNDTYTLTVTANADWINAKGRNFPVTIDFTSAKANVSDGTRDLDIDDTYIDSDDPNVAHGFRTWLWVRSNRTTYIKIPTPTLQANAHVTQAELTAYYYYYEYVNSGAVNVSAHQVNGGNWNEDELTWSGIANLSNYGLFPTPLDTITAAAANAKINNPGESNFDITGTFRNWVNGNAPNYGIGLKYAAGSSNLSVLFMSSESGYSYCPRITYHYSSIVVPTIKSRSEWNARDPIQSRLVERMRPPERIVFHHSADSFTSVNNSQIITEIQEIQNKQMDNKEKCDIAYHFIIDPAGNIWQGAEVDGYQRGHTQGYFDDIGVVILGDFESRVENFLSPNELNDNQKTAMKTLSKWLCYKYNLSLDEAYAPITTHRTLDSGTVCPGENAAPWIEHDLAEYIEDWYG